MAFFRSLPGIENKRGNPEQATARAVSIGPSGAYRPMTFGSLNRVGGWDFEKAIHQSYEKLINVYRPADAIAMAAANRVLRVQQGTPRPGEGRRVFDPQLEYVLNRRANKYETAWQFRYRLSTQLLFSRKGCFVEVVRNKDNRVAELHLLDPSNVEPIPDPDHFVSGYRVMQAGAGSVELDTDQVIWLKLKPHPQDPYLQMTPLEAASMVVETEILSRIFNRATVSNNGKPGQLILIDGDMSTEDQSEIKARFNGGPASAGRTTVISGTGLNHLDLAATPSELQYLQGLETNANDMQLAFGTPKSVQGDASGRTFDNAAAERLGWWMDTMVPHCNAIAACWDSLTQGGIKDDFFVVTDYEDVDVLQKSRRDKEDRMLTEFTKGVRTLDDFLISVGRKPTQSAVGRVYFIPAGQVPVGDPNDVQEVLQEYSQVAAAGLGAPLPGQGDPSQMSPDQMSQAAQQGALQGYNQAQQSQANDTAARALQLVGKALDAITRPETKELTPPAEDHTDDANREPPIDAEVVAETVVLRDAHPSVRGPHPYAALRLSCESEMAGLLTAWTTRQSDVVSARLNSKTARRNTRHWVSYEGTVEGWATKVLDPSYIVEIERWASELADSFDPLVNRVVDAQIRRTVKEVNDEGLITKLNNAGGGAPGATHPVDRLFGTGKAQYEARKAAQVADVKNIITTAAHNQSARIQKKIRQMDADGRTTKQIETEIKRMTSTRHRWHTDLARNVTTTLVEGSVYKTLEPVGAFIERKWNDQDDDRVRNTHTIADGQMVIGEEPFIVGGAPLMFPGDPAGPPQEVINCRCYQTFSVLPDGEGGDGGP